MVEVGVRLVEQHQEGGLLRELRVRPGQVVRRGEVLLVIGDVRSDAALDALRKQLDAERLRAARCRAELAFARQVDWPADAELPAAAAESRARERSLFESRRQMLDDQLAALQAQAHDAQARIAALGAQLEAGERSTRLAADELAINTTLAESGFIQKTRLLGLERGMAELHGRSEATRGQIAEARLQSNGVASSLAQARGAYRQRAADELQEAGARIRELEERLRPSSDQVERQNVRAPVDGTVMALRVSAPGTAVGPREPLLELLPSDEALRVEMRIDPHDIDHVRAGADAEVRLSAFDARSTKLLKARVASVSPDALTDPQTRQPAYLAQVEVPASEMALQPQLRLQPGMPAEVFVTTPSRSLAEYLLKPLGVFARRALREP